MGAPPGAGGWEGHNVAQGWEGHNAAQEQKYDGKRALSAAVRNYVREAHDSEGQRHPGGTPGAGPAGQGTQKTVKNRPPDFARPSWGPAGALTSCQSL